MRVHWAGGVVVENGDGTRVIWARGWPCCCTGDRARKIQTTGDLTENPAGVTCKKCVATMERGGIDV